MFKVGDYVIVTTNFASSAPNLCLDSEEQHQGVIIKVDNYNNKLSPIYSINDRDGEFLGRFYTHQINLDIISIRNDKLNKLL